MKIWEEIEEFFFKHAGKTALASGIVAVAAIGSVILLPPTGIVYTIALAGSGISLVVAGIEYGVWRVKQRMEERGEHAQYDKQMQQDMEDINEAKKMMTISAQKDIERQEKQEVEALKAEELKQDIGKLKDYVETQLELQAQSITDIDEAQLELKNDYRKLNIENNNLRAEIEKLKANGQGLSSHGLFSLPKIPEERFQHQRSNNQLH